MHLESKTEKLLRENSIKELRFHIGSVNRNSLRDISVRLINKLEEQMNIIESLTNENDNLKESCKCKN